MTLPQCDFRGDPALDHKQRPRHQCTHPKMLQGGPVVLVSDSNCHECQYCTFDAQVLIRNYVRTKPVRVTTEEYAVRCSACNECVERKGNYCPLAGGCGLAAKLGVQSFHCPINKF